MKVRVKISKGTGMNKEMIKTINPKEFVSKIYQLWDDGWFLLTSGDFVKGHYNTMTVSWGFFGIMWNKPMAVVVVRPTRFTYEFMEKYDTFTLSSFDENYREDLKWLGTKSGRGGDKLANTQLTPVPSTKVAAPTFKEAELIIECKKTYWNDFQPQNFLNQAIEKNYPRKDYHRMYFGEIATIMGGEKYTVLP